LVVEVGDAEETGERGEDLDDRPELPGVEVLAVAADVPAAGEPKPRPRLRVVEHRLGRSRRVAVDALRNEHDEHPLAPGDRPLDHLASSVAPGTTVMCPANASSFGTLCFRQTPTTS
jgi:hypothetical protein